ncbi:uncharacterized protein VTP21DRAFT_10227 [Calcarisporiella thermophila]|uniref:uncharacterized protein n=1 Tax=Calcarisporiella thermophila TaxID=911321 RepID=UPI00374467C1
MLSGLHSHATVLRSLPGKNVRSIEVDQKSVVPGDIVVFSAGDTFPGDVRIIESKDLYVSQSILTGESLPVAKFEVVYHRGSDKELFQRDNICFMGTSILSGYGKAIVLATGDNTYFVSIAGILVARRPINAFQTAVRRISYLLIGFMFVMLPVVVVISGLVSLNSWRDAALFGISIAVGLTPEMLPMIVNTSLAQSARVLAKKKLIVKNLDAIQNFAAINVLCCDKTGTLTADIVSLVKFMDAQNKSSPDHVLKYAYLVAYFQAGLRSHIDQAILKYSHEFGQGNISERGWIKLDEIPIDFVRRRMSVLLSKYDSNEKPLLVMKDAVEEILSVCTSYYIDGIKVKEISDEIRENLLSMGNELNKEGLRVIAVASRQMEEFSGNLIGLDERAMVLNGFLAFLDPPKQSALHALNKLHDNSINIKILTGDSLSIARKICSEVGIIAEEDSYVSGHELNQLSPEDYKQTVERCQIFAKLTPLQKLKIVDTLRNNGNIVGYLGDGVNDALALHGSDVGISVDSGTSVAKESAGIVMAEKDLSILADGVVQGRITQVNTSKYIYIVGNFGNAFSLLIAAPWLPFLPMEPLQILVQNLLFDISQIFFPWDSVDPELIRKPRTWSIRNLSFFMICIGPLNSLCDIATFFVTLVLFLHPEQKRRLPCISISLVP